MLFYLTKQQQQMHTTFQSRNVQFVIKQHIALPIHATPIFRKQVSLLVLHGESWIKKLEAKGLVVKLPTGDLQVILH